MTKIKASVEDLDNNNDEQTAKASPGMLLQQARIKHHLTIDDIASRLRLRAAVIEAIEADDYDDIAGVVFVKGYLRAYAVLLGIDPKDVLRLVNGLNIKEERKPDKLLWQSRASVEKKERPFRALAILTFVCLFALGGIWIKTQYLANNQWSKGENVTAAFHQSTDLTKLALSDLSKLHPVIPQEDTKALNKEGKKA